MLCPADLSFSAICKFMSVDQFPSNSFVGFIVALFLRFRAGTAWLNGCRSCLDSNCAYWRCL